MSDFDGQSTGDTETPFDHRWDAFQDAAQATEGPLGELFQTIAFQHQRYCDDAEHQHVTLAESARMIQIVEAAMVASEWLRSNSSDGVTVVDAQLDVWRARFADLLKPGGRHRKPDQAEPPECEVA